MKPKKYKLFISLFWCLKIRDCGLHPTFVSHFSPLSQELCPNGTILHLMIYVQCQRSVSVQEVACPLSRAVESKALEVGVVDGSAAHLTF